MFCRCRVHVHGLRLIKDALNCWCHLCLRQGGTKPHWWWWRPGCPAPHRWSVFGQPLRGSGTWPPPPAPPVSYTGYGWILVVCSVLRLGVGLLAVQTEAGAFLPRQPMTGWWNSDLKFPKPPLGGTFPIVIQRWSLAGSACLVWGLVPTGGALSPEVRNRDELGSRMLMRQWKPT